MKKIKSRPGLLGSTVHFNEKGQEVGTSYKGAFKTDHYDANGKRVGSTYHGSIKDSHYDTRGRNVGSSYKGGFKTDHYGKTGKVGTSYKHSWGSDTWLDDD